MQSSTLPWPVSCSTQMASSRVDESEMSPSSPSQDQLAGTMAMKSLAVILSPAMQSAFAALDPLEAVERDVDVACPVVRAVGRVGVACVTGFSVMPCPSEYPPNAMPATRASTTTSTIDPEGEPLRGPGGGGCVGYDGGAYWPYGSGPYG